MLGFKQSQFISGSHNDATSAGRDINYNYYSKHPSKTSEPITLSKSCDIGFYNLIQKVLRHEIQANLKSFRVNEEKHIESVKKFISNDYGLMAYSSNATKFSEKDFENISPSSKRDWLGKEGELQPACEEKLKEKEITIALAPILMGGTAIFYYLKRQGYNIKIINSFIHASNIIEEVYDNLIDPDIILGADGMLAQLNKNTEIRKEYKSWLFLNYFDISVVVSRTLKNKFFKRNLGGEFVYSYDDGSPNGLSVTHQRMNNAGILESNLFTNHKNPFEALAKLYSNPDSKAMYLLYSLQTNFALEMGLGQKIEIKGLSSLTKVPVVVIAKDSFIKSKDSENFRIAIEKAWFHLCVYESEREETIEYMINDESFIRVMKKLSGYDQYLVKQALALK